MFEYLPQYVGEDTRPVSAVSPGVLGTTGIETLEILKGVVEKTGPKLLIVVDALASRKMERISSTIQIGNTGIAPGAGVGNKRKEISENTLGIPVLAIGVPTVVDAVTIANDTIEVMIENMKKESANNNDQGILSAIDKLEKEDQYELIKNSLMSADYNFIVTPKEIDEIITSMSKVIGKGINLALN